MISRARPVLGTIVEIHVDPLRDESMTVRIFALAFAIIETVHQLMSVHDPYSDLSHINRLPVGERYQPHPWTLMVLRRAKRIHAWSQGLFDPAVAGERLCAWQQLPDYRRLNVVYGRLDDVVIEGHQVWLKQPVYLDFGGIAKGFAVDLAVHGLARLGVKQALINAGGDLRVLGAAPHTVWVRHPHDPQQLYALGQLAQGACATSGIYYSQITDQHGIAHSALVDPIQRQSSGIQHSYTVLANTAVYADALTKVVAASQNPQHPALARCGAQAIMLDSFDLERL